MFLDKILLQNLNRTQCHMEAVFNHKVLRMKGELRLVLQFLNSNMVLPRILCELFEEIQTFTLLVSIREYRIHKYSRFA